MNSLFLSLLIPFLAGISTILGYFPTYISEKYQDTVIGVSLAFSAGVMLCISFFSLLPEALHTLPIEQKSLTFFIILLLSILGMILSSSIDYQISKHEQKSKLYQLGIFSVITLILHNIPEGITTFLTTTSNLKLGISLSLAIALHNIPEGIAIAVPIFYSTGNRRKAFFYTTISGFSEFLGALFALFFLKNVLNAFLLAAILAATAGVMIHLSITELIPNAFDYINLKKMLWAFLWGFAVMIICIFIFHI